MPGSLLAATLVWASVAAAGPVSAGIEVQGHRGARALRPENTLAAFSYALKTGVDVLEMDLAVTRDGVLVVSHDPVLNPTLCQDAKGRPAPATPIVALRLKQVQRYDCGSLKNPRFERQVPQPGQRIPTLKQVFELVAKTPGAERVRFNLETKLVPGRSELTVTPKRFVELILKLVRQFKLQKRVSVQSFDYRSLAQFRKVAPEIERVVLVSDSLHDPVAVAQAVGAAVYSSHHRWLTREDIKRLHQHNIRVIPWTANTEADFRRLIELGVDGIITDDPALLLKHLGRRPKP